MVTRPGHPMMRRLLWGARYLYLLQRQRRNKKVREIVNQSRSELGVQGRSRVIYGLSL